MKQNANKNPKSNNNALDKGVYGYMSNRKHRLLVLSILSLTAVVIIFLTGIIRYHTNKSIFAVIAALSALPAAKFLTLYFAIFKYKTGDEAFYKTLKEIADTNNATLICDTAISSTTKISYIQFSFICGGRVLMYTEDPKTDITFATNHIKKTLDQNCNYSMVKIFTSKDKMLEHVKNTESQEKTAMDERIADKILSYSM